MKFFVQILTAFALAASCMAEPCGIEGKVKHRFLRAGWKSGAVEVFSPDGKSEWKVESPDEISDAWGLPDGGAIYSFSRRKQNEAGVIRLDGNQKVLWEYYVEKGRDNHSCQPLSHGGFLLGESAPNGLWMVELDKDGKEIKRVKVADSTGDYHHAFRHVRKTTEGTYLGTIMKENKSYEWDAEGKRIRTFPNGLFVAIRLPNGNTLTSGRDSGSPDSGPVVEFDKEGKVVWKLTADDLPFHMNMPCGIHRLSNGNTVVSNVWHGKHTDKTAPMLYEITPEKEVVWKVYTPGGNMGSVQVLDDSGDVYAGGILR